MPRHKHADCIIAWAEGKQIQSKKNSGQWLDCHSPHWFEYDSYRIKPEKKKGWINIYRAGSPYVADTGPIYHTKADATTGSGARRHTRIACIEIEYEEGQGLPSS